MGNNQSSSSSSHHSSHASTPRDSRSRSATSVVSLGLSDDLVDGGALEPQSWTYASSIADYSRPTVHRLIHERRLAPFHVGLQDFDDEWGPDEVERAIVDAEQHAGNNLADALEHAREAVTEAEATQQTTPPGTRKSKEVAQQLAQAVLHRERLNEIIKHRSRRAGGPPMPGINRQDQAKLYTGRATECPICFLYYPPNMVHTRCCDQPICTECFVQIKRAEPDATHLESEPAACPYCMEPNFGCVYFREPERPAAQSQDSAGSSAISTGEGASPPATSSGPKQRRKSFAHTDREVVTTDQIHPDWEAKLEAVKAQVARRANRRIVFRQVGDRLIPVGITSGRASDGANPTISTATLPPGLMAQVAAAMDQSNGGSGSSRRSTRRRNQEFGAYLQSMGLGAGPDLEEMMVEEAMRLSLLEDEERQRKEREEREKAAKNSSTTATSSTGASSPTSPAETSAQGAARSTGDLIDVSDEAPATPASPQRHVGSQASTPTAPRSPVVEPRTQSTSTTSAAAASPPARASSTSATATSTAPPPAPAAAPRLEGSTPLLATPTASSLASSVSGISSVEVPLSPTAGYQQLPDDDDDG